MVGGGEVANNGGLRASSPIANGGEPGVSQFLLSPRSLLKIQKGDITRWSVDGSSDAIVNPANERMLGGGGADGGFRLPASHVIHTVGPIFYEADDPAALLRNAYRNSLRVAREKNIQYVAFPAISCSVYGYPYDEAATVAISTVREFGNDIKEVHFVLYADDIFYVWLKKAAELLQN